MTKRRNKNNANTNAKMETHQLSDSLNKGQVRRGRGRGHAVLTQSSSDNENDNNGKVRLGLSAKSIKIQKSHGASNFEKQSLRSQAKTVPTVLAASRSSNSGTLSSKPKINQSLLELPNDAFTLAGLAPLSASGSPTSAYVSVQIERYNPAVGVSNSSGSSNFGRSTSKRVSHRRKRKVGDTDSSTSDQEDLRNMKKQPITPAESIPPSTKSSNSQTVRLPKDVRSVSEIRRHSILLNGANKRIKINFTEGAVSTTATRIQAQPKISTSSSTDGLASSSSSGQLSASFENGMEGNNQSQIRAISMSHEAHTALSASATMYSRDRTQLVDTNNQWTLRSTGIRQKLSESFNTYLQKEVDKQQYSQGEQQVGVSKLKINADVFQNPRIAKSGYIQYPNPFVELTPMVLIENQNNIFDPVLKAQEELEVVEARKREESQPQLQAALETASGLEGIGASSHSTTSVQIPTIQGRHILQSNIISINSTSNSKTTVSNNNDHWINQAPLTRRRASEAAVLTAETDTDVNTSVGLSSVVAIPPRTKSLAHTDYPQTHVFVCDFCLVHSKLKWIYDKHLSKSLKCQVRGNHPPGRIVYEKGTTLIYEVDGNVYGDYCFNLSKLSKRYVNSVSNRDLTKEFMYYVLYISNRFAGYFSKEKALTDVLNLGVLLVLPSHQKQGFGKLLVSFSYEISKLEKQIGTPERPFSESGLKCYLSYWMEKIVEYVTTRNLEHLTLDELSKETYIHVNDILEAIKTFCKVYKVRDFCLVKFPKSVCNRFFKTASMRAGNEAAKVTGNGPSTSTGNTDIALVLSTTTITSLKNNILDVKCIRWSK